MKTRKIKINKSQVGQLAPLISFLLISIISQSWPKAHYEIVPDIMLAIIYYWSIFRPGQTLIIAFSAIGVVEDCLSGTLIGFTSCLWLSLYLLILTQRRFFIDKSFLLVWAGFMVFAALIFIIKWLSLNYLNSVSIPLQPLFFSYLLSVGFYPLIARLLWFITRYLNV